MVEPSITFSHLKKQAGYCGLILSWCPWPFWPDFWGTWSVCCGNVTRNVSQAISRHGVDTINMLTSGSQTWQSQPSIDRWFSHFNTHYCPLKMGISHCPVWLPEGNMTDAFFGPWHSLALLGHSNVETSSSRAGVSPAWHPNVVWIVGLSALKMMVTQKSDQWVGNGNKYVSHALQTSSNISKQWRHGHIETRVKIAWLGDVRHGSSLFPIDSEVAPGCGDAWAACCQRELHLGGLHLRNGGKKRCNPLAFFGVFFGGSRVPSTHLQGTSAEWWHCRTFAQETAEGSGRAVAVAVGCCGSPVTPKMGGQAGRSWQSFHQVSDPCWSWWCVI